MSTSQGRFFYLYSWPILVDETFSHLDVLYIKGYVLFSVGQINIESTTQSCDDYNRTIMKR